MHGNAHTAQRREECLQPVGQAQRARRQCQQRTQQNEQDETQPDIHTARQPLPRRRQWPDGKQFRPRRHKEMHAERKEHDPENRTNRAQLHPERNLRNDHEQRNADAERKKACRVLDKENKQQVEEQENYLDAWIHAVQKGISGQIASDLYVIQQITTSIFSFFLLYHLTYRFSFIFRESYDIIS